MEDNNKKGQETQPKSKDLSNQFDKLFSSLNIGKEKKEVSDETDFSQESNMEFNSQDLNLDFDNQGDNEDDSFSPNFFDGDTESFFDDEEDFSDDDTSWGFDMLDEEKEETSNFEFDSFEEESSESEPTLDFSVQENEEPKNEEPVVNFESEPENTLDQNTFEFDDSLLDESLLEVDENTPVVDLEESINLDNDFSFDSIEVEDNEVQNTEIENNLSYEGLLEENLADSANETAFNFEESHEEAFVEESIDSNNHVLEVNKIDYNNVVSSNELMNIDSIYSCHDLIKQMSDTVFMIEVYAKTLPDNLPKDVKRQSVLNIIKASNIEIDSLLSDAYKRIDVLNEVLEDVAQKCEELDDSNNQEIKDLEQKIQDLKLKIQARVQYKQSQNAMIGYEIQRIVNIVEFIEPE